MRFTIPVFTAVLPRFVKQDPGTAENFIVRRPTRQDSHISASNRQSLRARVQFHAPGDDW
jgi:hypothetical protein